MRTRGFLLQLPLSLASRNCGGLLRLPRLFRPFTYLGISAGGPVSPFSTRRNPPTLSRLLKTVHRNQQMRSLVSFQHKRTNEEGFCTKSTDAGEAKLFRPYISARFRCRKVVADSLSEALLCFGASSVSMEDINSQDCGETWITSLFADDQDVHTCISLATESIGVKYLPEYEVSKVQQCDWLKNIQETFHPVEITTGLWIVPKWTTQVPNATNIILNPGMSFGTGEHPTTKLCLFLMHSLIRGGETFFDYGTGSGILGIAALKMGAELSVGIDVDPHAVASALENISLNEIGAHRMRVYLISAAGKLNSDVHSITKMNFDIVIANILLNPLLELADDIVSYGKPGAVIGLSGIISEQRKGGKECESFPALTPESKGRVEENSLVLAPG
ncbi:hypothetical protein KSP40_PGU020312 [Platanthera guangdongensis]|uniref:ETFB lysine methyltransferase n=1 Tax=Platanthera guangdongensis TaxID=2320717 RepID=A0ABR2M829_9ASPA